MIKLTLQLLAATCLAVIGVGNTILWSAIDGTASMLVTCVLFILASALIFYASYLDIKGGLLIESN